MKWNGVGRSDSIVWKKTNEMCGRTMRVVSTTREYISPSLLIMYSCLVISSCSASHPCRHCIHTTTYFRIIFHKYEYFVNFISCGERSIEG